MSIAMSILPPKAPEFGRKRPLTLKSAKQMMPGVITHEEHRLDLHRDTWNAQLVPNCCKNLSVFAYRTWTRRGGWPGRSRRGSRRWSRSWRRWQASQGEIEENVKVKGGKDSGKVTQNDLTPPEPERKECLFTQQKTDSVLPHLPIFQ